MASVPGPAALVAVEIGDVQKPHVAAVAESIGSDRILFASDFPHYDAVFPGAVQAFVANSGLADDTRREILGANAAKLLGLNPTYIYRVVKRLGLCGK